MNDALGDRMKKYENTTRYYLPPRTPIIIRVDGKAFHTYTKNCTEPFSNVLINIMNEVGLHLCKNIQGAELAYIQSDEISILVHYYKKYNSSAWFDNNLQKLVSVSASLATEAFINSLMRRPIAWQSQFGGKTPNFDSRAFCIPVADVCNYFIWRQKDWERNSLQLLARSLHSHNELYAKKRDELHDMCIAKGNNWNHLPGHYKRGRCVKLLCGTDNPVPKREWNIETPPIFTKDRDYVEEHLFVEQGEV